MIKYNQKFKIPYYEADKYNYLTPVALLEYLGEVSTIHNSILVDQKKMEKLNYGWMLNKWKVKIDKYLHPEQTIRIESWISEIDKFYAYREFIIYNEEDIEIGKATAVWIFLDMSRKRPIRIKEEHYDLENTFDQKMFNEFHRFKPNIKVENIIEFNIRKSDIDYNDHVNNTRYLEWMVESIPEETYEKYFLSEFEIQYKQEIKYPNVILSGSKEINKLEEEINYNHKIEKKQSDDENCLGISKWIKK